jgi:hypothetical protein
MKKKYFFIVVFGILCCMLAMDELVFQPLVNHDSNLVYAMGRRPPRPPRPDRPTPDRPPLSVPEPSILLLLGTGALGIGFYLHRNHTKKK